MSWEAIVRKDFEDAVRSYWLWGLSAVFIGVLALPPALIVFDVVQITQPARGPAITTDVYVGLMRDTMTVLVPIIAIVAAYASITGERDSGTLKLLLSLPHSRLEVVVGKVIGRSLVLASSVLAGFVVAAAVFLATPVTFNFGTYASFTLLTVLLGIVFVGIAVGVSAAARSSRSAMIGTVGLYVYFTLLWDQSVNGLLRLLTRHTGLAPDSSSIAHLDLVLNLVNPTQAYKSLVAVLTLPAEVPISFAQPNVTVPRSAAARMQVAGGHGREIFVDGAIPVYYSDPAVLVILLAWLIGVPVLGYLVFRDVDL